MARAQAFYEGVLGLEPIYSDNRLTAYAVAGCGVGDHGPRPLWRPQLLSSLWLSEFGRFLSLSRGHETSKFVRRRGGDEFRALTKLARLLVTRQTN